MRRISPATVTISVLAILLALGVAYYLKPRETVEQTQRERQIEVVVAAVNLVADSEIIGEQVVVQAFNETEYEKQYKEIKDDLLANANTARGRFINASVNAGDPILKSVLYKVGERPSLDLKLGEVAKMITVTGTSNSGNFVHSGSVVNISLTVSGTHPILGNRDPNELIKARQDAGHDVHNEDTEVTGGSVDELQGIGTRTFLHNVRVLKVNVDRTPLRRVASRTALLTVAVTPRQGQLLELAQNLGTLHVALIGAAVAAETTEAPAEFVTAADLGIPRIDLIIPQVPPSPVVEPPPKSPAPKRVEAWSGSDRKILTFPADQNDDVGELPLQGESA